MKTILRHTLLFLLFVFVISTGTNAQWQPSLGLEGGRNGQIIQSDSFLITTCENTIYRTSNDFTSPWDTCPDNTGGGGGFLQVDSCIISYGIMHGMGRSFDNGLTWQWIPGYGSTASMCSVGSTIFFDYGNFLFKSDDYMDSAEMDTLFPDISFMILFSNDSLLIAMDYNLDAIYHSTDTANSWDTITLNGLPTEQTSTFCITYYDNTIWLAGIYGVYYLNPEKTTWIEVNSGIPTGKWVWGVIGYNSELYCTVGNSGLFIFIPADSLWTYIENSPKNIRSISDINGELYCGSSNGPVKMDSLGIWHTNFEGLYHRNISSLSELNDTIYVYANDELFKSYDEGYSFEKIENVNGKQIITTDSIFYSLSYTDIIISRDYGVSWDTITKGLHSSLHHFSLTDSYYYVSSSHGLFRSRVDTINWIVLDEGLNTWTISHFEAIDSVVIVNDYYYSHLVCISKDYGDTFDTLFITDGAFFPITKIGNRFYILNMSSILYSDDLGETWNEIFKERSFSLDQNEDYLVVGSDGPGPIEYLTISYDNGLTWTDIEGNLPSEDYGLYDNITFHNQRLFTSSSDNSLWYRDDILTKIPENDITDDKHEKVNLYPNPVKDVITLELETTPDDCRFRVFDIQGREQINGTLNTKKTDIDLGKLKPGIYIIEVLTASGKTTRKIVKY